jgi:hypothetical protein
MERSHRTQLFCTTFECVGTLNKLSFPKGNTIYLYLYNNHFTQNVIEGIDIDEERIIKNCLHFATNAEIEKNVSILGGTLEPTAKALPCGELALFYPQSVLTITDIKANLSLNIKSDGLSLGDFGFTNSEFAKQWADVTTAQYSVWS